MKRRIIALLGLSGLILMSCGRTTEEKQNVPANGFVLIGTSSSSIATAYRQWFAQLAVRENINADIQVMGSGESIHSLVSGKVDFSGTDTRPDSDDFQKARRGMLAFPVTARSIAVAYNHPGCSLKLTRDQLVSIFLGKITDFAELGCRKQPIRVMHRQSASGTTAAFTETLSAFSAIWRKGPGHGLQVKWPIGTPVEGSEAMIQRLTKIPGGMGYVEAALVDKPLATAGLASRSGGFLQPTSIDTARAINTIKLDQHLLGQNPDPEVGYPIVSLAWVLVPNKLNAAKATALRRSLNYMLTQAGQDDAERLGYIPLSDAILIKSRQQVDKIQP